MARTPRDVGNEPVLTDINTTEPTVPQQSASIRALSEPVTQDDFEGATARVNSDVTLRDIKRKALAKRYNAEPKISVMVAPSYKAYFGQIMHVSVNGISMSVPCDGRPYSVPESYARVVQTRLRKINEQIEKQSRYADIPRNVESSPGQLELHT